MKNKKFKLVISSGKGGVGKSMLASSLAILFAQMHKLVALDCDVDAPNLAIWLSEVQRWDKIKNISVSEKPVIDYKKCNSCGLCAKYCQFGAIKMIKKKPIVNPFTCEGCGACEIFCPQKAIELKPVKSGKIKIKKTKYGFPLISGQLFPGEVGSGKIVSEVKREADQYEYEIIIIDSSPGTGCPVIASLQDANFVVLVTEPTPSAFTDLKRVLEVVNYFQLPYRVVINKWDLDKGLSQKIKKWAEKRFLGQISYDQQIFQAISKLRPIMETKLKAKKEIKNIFNNLVRENLV